MAVKQFNFQPRRIGSLIGCRSMNFLLVTTPHFDQDGANKSARAIFEERISKNRWAIYTHTRNKKRLRKNDNVIFYVSNRKTGGEVVARAKIFELIRPKRYERFEVEKDTVEFFLSFDSLDFFETPVLFKDVLPKMSFCPSNITKWGVVLIGGVRYLSDRDFKILTNQTLKI